MPVSFKFVPTVIIQRQSSDHEDIFSWSVRKKAISSLHLQSMDMIVVASVGVYERFTRVKYVKYAHEKPKAQKERLPDQNLN